MRRREFLQGLGLTTVTSLNSLVSTAAVGASSEPPGSGLGPSSLASYEAYPASSRVRSGMALGGIGAGSVELRKDGRFYNWSIFNNAPKETGSPFQFLDDDLEDPLASVLFFKVRYQTPGKEPRIQLLQLPDGLNEGGIFSAAYLFPWMQTVDQIEYAARFPFAKLRYTADSMPFDIELEAWSPFIPHDVKNSALPLIYFDFKLIPRTQEPVDVLLLMCARNSVGYDQEGRFFTTAIVEAQNRKSIVMSSGGIDKTSGTWGEVVLSSLSAGSTHYTGWSHLHPYYEHLIRNGDLPNLDDTDGKASLGTVPDWMPATDGRNHYDAKTGSRRLRKNPNEAPSRLFCTIAKSLRLTGPQPCLHTFTFAWNFPNLYAESSDSAKTARNEGHYYSNFFSSGLDVASYGANERQNLYNRSRQFQADFFDSDIPVEILEQVNSHLNTFVTSGRLVRDGSFGILEGLSARASWGPIATIDVMLYGTAPIIALFPELQKSTMLRHAAVQSAEGEISHGMLKNFGSGEDGTAGVSHRLDLPGQFAILALRDYFYSGDLEYLRKIYPHVQRAIDYVINHRAFAHNAVPIMRGIECSYDNFPMYGYASYLVSQWLCCLSSAIAAAEILGNDADAEKYRKILKTTEEIAAVKLWNGEYYRLYNDADRAGENGSVNEGVLTDQVIGQWLAHQSGLGYILPREKMQSALRAILRANYRPEFGLKNSSWPGQPFLSPVPQDIWVDQANTCWSGVELAFASLLLYEGYQDEAEAVIRTVDQRYRRNGLYWDHQEFGGHYFRPMSSWAILSGYLGLGIHGDTLRFAPRARTATFRYFFVTSSGTAHFRSQSQFVTIRCSTGVIALQQLEIWQGKSAVITLRGQLLDHDSGPAQDHVGYFHYRLAKRIVLNPSDELKLVFK